MTIINSEVIDGPDTEVGGKVKGRVRYTFADGREVICRLMCPSIGEWPALVTSYTASLERTVALQDAARGIEDEPIAATQTATQAQRAVAYVQKALEQKIAYDAYRMLDRMNDWRRANGWTVNQVRTQLIDAGLRETDFDKAIAAYQYLSQGTRPAEMAAAASIQAVWEAN